MENLRTMYECGRIGDKLQLGKAHILAVTVYCHRGVGSPLPHLVLATSLAVDTYTGHAPSIRTSVQSGSPAHSRKVIFGGWPATKSVCAQTNSPTSS